MKKPTTIRLSPETIERVELLSKKLETSRTQVIERAVRKMAESEGISVARKEPKSDG